MPKGTLIVQASRGYCLQIRRAIYVSSEHQKDLTNAAFLKPITHNGSNMPKLKIKNVPVDEFTAAYLEAAFWSSTYEPEPDMSEGIPIDRDFEFEDLSQEALDQAIADCTRFQQIVSLLEIDFDKEIKKEGLREHTPTEYAGHDFWLNRVGHGSGFWERYDWNERAGNLLDQLCRWFGEVDLYVGDDKQLYFSGGRFGRVDLLGG